MKKRSKLRRNTRVAFRSTLLIAYLSLTIIVITSMSWLFISWAEVNMKNTSTGSELAEWNAFEVLGKWATEQK